ncbi:hypothetical protein [Kineococcus esterisolvens]
MHERQRGRVGQWLVEHCPDQPIRTAARSCLVRLRVHLLFRSA